MILLAIASGKNTSVLGIWELKRPTPWGECLWIHRILLILRHWVRPVLYQVYGVLMCLALSDWPSFCTTFAVRKKKTAIRTSMLSDWGQRCEMLSVSTYMQVWPSQDFRAFPPSQHHMVSQFVVCFSECSSLLSLICFATQSDLPVKAFLNAFS